MVLDQLRPQTEKAFTPWAARLNAWGVKPNSLSIASLFFAAFAALAFVFAMAPGREWLLLVASALVGLNALADGFDGRLARLQGSASVKGDYLDHVIDRYADLGVLTAIGLAGWVDLRITLFALLGTALTSYMGTQAQALGLGRNYRGLLARADRIFILITFPLLEFARLTWYPVEVPYVGTVLGIALLYIAVVGNLTAVQRFWHGWREITDREKGLLR
ncbi:MAG TPA: CDP-alcohol phosphatidyltransferase family protein [Candidatus Thermoplasmatota archaeon]|nr:CDP-alcohol phosphatidyltransferase family protein [Candidatus Thermoplasmatota archaeon]